MTCVCTAVTPAPHLSLENDTSCRIIGSLAFEYNGYSVAVGDVNKGVWKATSIAAAGMLLMHLNAVIMADGISDVMSGEPASGSFNDGITWVLYGRNSSTSLGAWPSELQVSTSYFDGSNGFYVKGQNNGDQAGLPVRVGDFNNDGYADMFIGAQQADNSGVSVLCVVVASCTHGK